MTSLRRRESNSGWGFLIMFEFQIRPGMEKRFEKAYGAKGDWARLFRQDESFIATELLHVLKDRRTYVTLDFWTSQEAYDAFRRRHFAEYEAFDQKCDALTETEREIGRFVRVSSK
jgi:heme-degrading monooxygenase HmoA